MMGHIREIGGIVLMDNNRSDWADAWNYRVIPSTGECI